MIYIPPLSQQLDKLEFPKQLRQDILSGAEYTSIINQYHLRNRFPEMIQEVISNIANPTCPIEKYEKEIQGYLNLQILNVVLTHRPI
jgi:hypothetical protein